MSDGQHFIGSRPFRGGHSLLAYHQTRPEEGAFLYHALAMAADGATHLVPFVVAAAGFDLVETTDVSAPFDRFAIGGERLPELPKA